ncbi:DUF2141 domain-containing protein [Portibacter lacus]|uniref:DUF2141 domain-containing protein n=1 Tax=Portibacter lacus TaxID=1099794 RepID=A0AA37STC9_9BACT|nr:DUF2141 domain-containing protein [Portibacter lacus]GLR17763.1 hypothetical protein GCM10007940_23780 [Portibacter lacus]
MTYIIYLAIQLILNNPTALAQEAYVNDKSNIVVHVTNIENMEGEILVGIYDSKKTFRKIKKVFKYAIQPVENGQEVIVIEDVPSGQYAIALFQDVNGNRKFDTNFMGVPKEPFGFSTNYVVKRRAPKFNEVLFEHGGNQDTEMTIDMQEW